MSYSLQSEQDKEIHIAELSKILLRGSALVQKIYGLNSSVEISVSGEGVTCFSMSGGCSLSHDLPGADGLLRTELYDYGDND
jgi:hypothetical protein